MKKLFCIIFAFMACISISAFASNNNKFNQTQVKEIQNIVHNYLVKNPHVLVEASITLQKQRAQQQQQQMQQMAKIAISSAKTHKKELFTDKMSPTFGPEDAQVVIVELFDYQCGHCKMMSPVMKSILEKNKNIKIIYKEFPIFGQNSEYAAKASLAAYQLDPEKYLGFHDLLLSQADPLNIDTVLSLAKKSGYAEKMLIKTIKKDSTEGEIQQTQQLAEAMKINYTPAFIIANKSLTKIRFVPGATSQENLQKIIDELKQ